MRITQKIYKITAELKMKKAKRGYIKTYRSR